VSSDCSSLNYGNEPSISLGEYQNKNKGLGFFGFKFPPLDPRRPVHAEIFFAFDTIAKHLDVGSEGLFQLKIYATDDNWQENEINWDNAPKKGELVKCLQRTLI
jgi:hypothetical protein